MTQITCVDLKRMLLVALLCLLCPSLRHKAFCPAKFSGAVLPIVLAELTSPSRSDWSLLEVRTPRGPLCRMISLASHGVSELCSYRDRLENDTPQVQALASLAVVPDKNAVHRDLITFKSFQIISNPHSLFKTSPTQRCS